MAAANCNGKDLELVIIRLKDLKRKEFYGRIELVFRAGQIVCLHKHSVEELGEGKAPSMA